MSVCLIKQAFVAERLILDVSRDLEVAIRREHRRAFWGCIIRSVMVCTMTTLRMSNLALTALLGVLGVSNVEAFSGLFQRMALPTKTASVRTTTARFMAEGGDKKVPTVKSGRKELAYDEASGRFFEADEKECVPEDEFCVTDKATGKLIRLTVEEKERIFLDALQVSWLMYYIISVRPLKILTLAV